MRISNWCSDVCSSDLPLAAVNCHNLAVHVGRAVGQQEGGEVGQFAVLADASQRDLAHPGAVHRLVGHQAPPGTLGRKGSRRDGVEADSAPRSEARPVGKECVSTCRSRWPPETSKKKKLEINNI